MAKSNKVTTIAILDQQKKVIKKYIFLIGFQCQVSLPASEVSDPKPAKASIVTEHKAGQMDFPTVWGFLQTASLWLV